MPTINTEALLLDIADTAIADKKFLDNPHLNPLLKEFRCQERAVYFILLLNKIRAGESISTQERLMLGAAILLTVNADIRYDDFGMICRQTLKESLDSGFQVPPTNKTYAFKTNKSIRALLDKARELLATGVRAFIQTEGALESIDALNPQTQQPFHMPKSPIKLEVLPFYASVVGSLRVVKERMVRIAIKSIQLGYDALAKTYTPQRQDLLIFPPPEPNADPKELCFVVQGYQIVQKGEEASFEDDVAKMREDAISAPDIIRALAAVHNQLSTEMLPPYAEAQDPGEPSLYADYQRDYQVAFRKGLKDQVYSNGMIPTQNIAFSVSHIEPQTLGTLLEEKTGARYAP